MKFRLPVLVVIQFYCVSCILPIPHRRAHFQGVAGKVIDSQTEQPISAARVCSLPGSELMTHTDPAGKFAVKSQYGWHGAYLIGPISYSLFPHFDMPHGIQGMRIEADGYRSGEIAGHAGSVRSSPFHSIRDVGTIRLTPKSPAR